MTPFRRSTKRQIFRSKRKFKHVVDVSSVNANFSAGVNSALLIEGVDNPSTTTTTDVESGNNVNALFIELNVGISANASVTNVMDWYLIFNPQNLISTFPDPLNIGASTFKSYVFKQGMEMIANGSSTMKKIGLIKIPPKYRRIGRGDMIYVVWKSRVNNGAVDSFCFKSIFKEIKS